MQHAHNALLVSIPSPWAQVPRQRVQVVIKESTPLYLELRRPPTALVAVREPTTLILARPCCPTAYIVQPDTLESDLGRLLSQIAPLVKKARTARGQVKMFQVRAPAVSQGRLA